MTLHKTFTNHLKIYISMGTRGLYWYFNPVTAPFKWYKLLAKPDRGAAFEEALKNVITFGGYDKMHTSRQGFLDSIMDNLIKHYGHTGATDQFIEEANIQLENQQILNEDEWQRKLYFYENYESPSAMVRQYKQAGLNPMLLAGGGASVSASGGIGSPGSAQGGHDSSADPLAAILSIAGLAMRQSQFHQNLEIEKQRVGVSEYEAETRRIQVQNQNEMWKSIINLNQQRYDFNEQFYPASLENVYAQTDALYQQIRTGQADAALKWAGVSRAKAETALAIRQEALLRIQEKHAELYYSYQNSLMYYQSQLAKTQSEFERRTLEKRIKIVDKNLDLMMQEEVGRILENGLKGYDFSTFGQQNARAWIDTGANVLRSLGSFMTGGAIMGRAAGAFGSTPMFDIKMPQMEIAGPSGYGIGGSGQLYRTP